MKELAFFLGCDVSKGYCDFEFLNEKIVPVMRGFQLDDTRQGHQRLCGILDEFVRKQKKENREAIGSNQSGGKRKRKKKLEELKIVIYAGMESTGGYENNWHHLFSKLSEPFNLKVARINPAVIKNHKKTSGVKTDTDKVSARNIAEYMIRYPDKIGYNQQDYYFSARRHWKFVRLLKKQRIQLLGHLESLLYTSHPQILKHTNGEWPMWLLRVLEKYPTAQLLANAKYEDLVVIPYVTASRARDLIEEARTSVASSLEEGMEILIQSAVKHLIALEQNVKQQEKYMEETFSYPEVELLKTFKGIGAYAAVGLLIEIGVIERFATVKKLSSHWGTPPRFKESGDGVLMAKMSKKGRREPRFILFNVALSAINSNEMITQLYENYQAKGFCKMAAIGIIMHKIVRIIYGMLKHNTPYNPQIDLDNRRRAKKSQETKPEKKDHARRFQDFDKDAPLSNRQRKKRFPKEQTQPGGGDAKTGAHNDIKNADNYTGLAMTIIKKME